MRFERQLVDYIVDTKFNDLPPGAIATAKKMLLSDIGTTIAGAEADGCRTIAEYYGKAGGTEEATVLLYGDRLPAQNAVFVNAMMSRALDLCDAIAPGPHVGSATIPTALACAELRGGCTGKEFLTALVVGAEVAARLNLDEAAYDGFDPTGICVPFGATAVACKLLGLDKQQTWNALGLIFNSCGGSFQSHVDGSIGVRVNQGRIARESVFNARLAERRITGPRNFLTGIFGYLHLYGKDQFTGSDLLDGLGDTYKMQEVAFKKYPGCAMASGPTDVALSMLHQYELDPSKIQSVKLFLPPYGFRLVGHEFRIGENPTVDGQFSAQYCVANVLLRGSSRIRHFTKDAVCDPKIAKLISRISVKPDTKVARRGHTAMDMEIRMRGGKVYRSGIDIAPGFRGNPLTDEDHMQRYMDCVDFAPDWFEKSTAYDLVPMLKSIEKESDVRLLIYNLTAPGNALGTGTMQ